MNLEAQVRIMESHISNFDNLLEKLQYLKEFFGNDPEYTKEAHNIVIGNIAKSLPKSKEST